jgi:rod shape-determining protein MreB
MDGWGIDLGTANTVVCDAEGNIVLDEPSYIAFRLDGLRRSKLVGFGSEARALVGRAPEGVTVVRPLQDGVVRDLETTRRFLGEILRRIAPGRWQRRRASVVFGLPVGASALEHRALLEAAEEARIGRRPLMLAEPIAGAVGCGVDPLEARTHMVVDVGAGTSEVVVFGSGSVLAYRSCPLAGEEMTAALYQHLRQEYQVVVGELAAEEAKIRISAEKSPSLVVHGQDAATGQARMVSLEVEEILGAVRPVTEAIISTLAGCLEDLPAQSVADVMAEGLLVMGGGSLLPGFDRLLKDAFGFSVRLAERPLTCVAEGAARCLARPEVAAAYAIT